VYLLVRTARALVNPSFHTRYTCSGSWGLSRQEQLIQVCPLHARSPFLELGTRGTGLPERCLPSKYNNPLCAAEITRKSCDCLFYSVIRVSSNFDRRMSLFRYVSVHCPSCPSHRCLYAENSLCVKQVSITSVYMSQSGITMPSSSGAWA
jgi:hypothetical protein